MSFGSVLFTNKGRILQAKAETGIQLQFTKIGIGKGVLGETPISEVTGLIDSVINVNITTLDSSSNGQAKVGGVFLNEGLSEGFYWREIGLFANDPDIGEILYCYGNAGDLAEYIPAGGASEILEKYVSIVALVGNAENINANIDSSLVYATMQDVENKVDKIAGKGLSTEDYTADDKNKLAGIEIGAQVNRAISDSTSSASSSTAASSKAVKDLNDSVSTKMADISKQLDNYSSYASSIDSEGIYTVVDYKRADVTLYMKSTLSGGTSPQYTTDTWQFYDTDGATLLSTVTWTITYDVDGNIVSKVVA